jgi:hypothetical protein
MKNTGELKMTNKTFTEKEEIVLKVILDNAWEPNMISFDDVKYDQRLKEYEVNTLKGVFGSLCKKEIIMFDDEIGGNEIYTFLLPVAPDITPKKCFDGRVNTIEKVKQWFAEGKDKLNTGEWE